MSEKFSRSNTSILVLEFKQPVYIQHHQYQQSQCHGTFSDFFLCCLKGPRFCHCDMRGKKTVKIMWPVTPIELFQVPRQKTHNFLMLQPKVEFTIPPPPPLSLRCWIKQCNQKAKNQGHNNSPPPYI